MNEINKDINCIGILEYLENYKGKKYCSESKRTETNRKEIEENETAGKEAKKQLEKMAKICEEYFELKKSGPNDWLDGSGQKLREYLWVQLKAPDKKEKPESISLFVEQPKDKRESRFRISLEIHNREAKKYPGEKEKYHRHLEIPLNSEKGLVYISGSNEKGNISVIPEKSNEKVKKDLNSGKYEKVQISRIIEKTENLTNEECIKQMVEAVESLLPYYQYVVSDLKENKKVMEKSSKIEFDKNMILYGPPGTGKTYQTPIYAVAICEGKSLEEVKKLEYNEIIEKYKKLKKEGRIEFTTFHQSYGYEEFIEGIKPVLDNEEKECEELIDEESEEVKYKLEAGIFKKFCNKIEFNNIIEETEVKLNSSPKVWKVSLKQTGDNDVREECMQNEHIRINEYGEDLTKEIKNKYEGKNALNAFISRMKIGDIVLSCYSETTIDAIGVITGDSELHEEYNECRLLRDVKWLVKGIRHDIVESYDVAKMTLSAVYKLKLKPDKALEIVKKYKEEKSSCNNYVFIIDEINRGNISKIFGELITLIEPSKRIGKKEECRVKLPYSKEEFGVPDNVYILGTMNTADRSIALMDTALRRRFNFIEMMPEVDSIRNIKIIDEETGKKIDIPKMLETINKRIEVLYDREHTIGHAFFMGLKEEPTIEKLKAIFEKSIIPLLKEYFYEDYSKIQLILGDKIVEKSTNEIEKIFKIDVEEIDIPEEKYTILTKNLDKIETYIDIYE